MYLIKHPFPNNCLGLSFVVPLFIFAFWSYKTVLIMVVRKTLRNGQSCFLGNDQIKEYSACSCLTTGEIGSGGTLLNCKGNSVRYVFVLHLFCLTRLMLTFPGIAHRKETRRATSIYCKFTRTESCKK